MFSARALMIRLPTCRLLVEERTKLQHRYAACRPFPLTTASAGSAGAMSYRGRWTRYPGSNSDLIPSLPESAGWLNLPHLRKTTLEKEQPSGVPGP